MNGRVHCSNSVLKGFSLKCSEVWCPWRIVSFTFSVFPFLPGWVNILSLHVKILLYLKIFYFFKPVVFSSDCYPRKCLLTLEKESTSPQPHPHQMWHRLMSLRKWQTYKAFKYNVIIFDLEVMLIILVI